MKSKCVCERGSSVLLRGRSSSVCRPNMPKRLPFDLVKVMFFAMFFAYVCFHYYFDELKCSSVVSVEEHPSLLSIQCSINNPTLEGFHGSPQSGRVGQP